MGFQKGSITLSPTRDIPLLLQVLHSRLITHEQLQEFMLLDNHEVKQACFNWRVRRLVQAGLLNRECARPITPSPVYTITPVAAEILAEHSPVLDNGRQKDVASANHLRHSIGLNELRLFLYIVPEPDLGSFIVECFAGTTVALFVGLAAEFTESFRD